MLASLRLAFRARPELQCRSACGRASTRALYVSPHTRWRRWSRHSKPSIRNTKGRSISKRFRRACSHAIEWATDPVELRLIGIAAQEHLDVTRAHRLEMSACIVGGGRSGGSGREHRAGNRSSDQRSFEHVGLQSIGSRRNRKRSAPDNRADVSELEFIRAPASLRGTARCREMELAVHRYRVGAGGLAWRALSHLWT